MMEKSNTESTTATARGGSASMDEPDLKQDLSSLEKPKLRYFASDHAVSGRQKTPLSRREEEEEASEPSGNAPVSSVDVATTRMSLKWHDILAARRRSSNMSSLVSSLTLTDYGESFFNDYGSQAELCRWDEDQHEDQLEDFDCDGAHGGECTKEKGNMSPCSCNACDFKPVCPTRRDSMSTGKISAPRIGRLAHDFPSGHKRDHIDTEKDLPQKKRSSTSDHNPIKPGRRESVATVEQGLLPAPGLQDDSA